MLKQRSETIPSPLLCRAAVQKQQESRLCVIVNNMPMMTYGTQAGLVLSTRDLSQSQLVGLLISDIM